MEVSVEGFVRKRRVQGGGWMGGGGRVELAGTER